MPTLGSAGPISRRQGPLSPVGTHDAKSDDAGFDAAFVDLFARAERVARRVVGDPATAEDIAAETLTRALVRWKRVSGHAGPWVTTVATNLAIDALRRRERESRLPPPTNPHEPNESRVTVAGALGKLSPQQRTVLVLRYLLDMSEDETARALGLSPETVKTHARRGLTTLRRKLGPTAEEVPDAIRRSRR